MLDRPVAVNISKWAPAHSHRSVHLEQDLCYDMMIRGLHESIRLSTVQSRRKHVIAERIWSAARQHSLLVGK